MMVSTGAISETTYNSTKVSGQIIDLGEGATQHGHYYSTIASETISGTKTQLGIPSGKSGFTSQLTGLATGTKYYIKAYISNGTETVYGKEISFSTVSASQLTLITAAVTSIALTTATSGGNITSEEGASVTTRGVCWNTATNPTIANSITSDGTGSGSFVSNLTSLLPGTTYHVRAYATNSVGTAYGNDVSFTTSPVVVATLTTTVVTSITSTTANSGGNITYDGGGTITARGVCWDTSIDPTVSSAHTTDDTGSSSFTSNLSGLSDGTTYYIHAYATNSAGTAYGDQFVFITPITDIEGNIYKTVKIGTQVWMAENLKTTKYNDGTNILLVTDQTEWKNLTTPAYCWYNNDLTMNKNIYGAIYNWYTATISNLCPVGWHVPTYEEWWILINLFGGEYNAGSKLKESGYEHWASPNTGATNESGFTALPGGWRQFGNFGQIGTNGSWYSSSGNYSWTIIYFYMNSYNKWTSWEGSVASDGYSIRCLKN